jgi:hypothetical protein
MRQVIKTPKGSIAVVATNFVDLLVLENTVSEVLLAVDSILSSDTTQIQLHFVHEAPQRIDIEVIHGEISRQGSILITQQPEGVSTRDWVKLLRLKTMNYLISGGRFHIRGWVVGLGALSLCLTPKA